MDYYCDLTSKLKELLHDESISPLTREEKIVGIKFLQLRDALFVLGDIFEENTEDKIYVASIKAGLGKLGRAYIATKLVGDMVYITAYAKEGLINQHMAEKSVDALMDLLKKKNANKTETVVEPQEKAAKRKNKKLIFYICLGAVLAILIVASIICGIVAGPFSKKSNEYNEAIDRYNSVAETYNQKSDAAFLENLKGFEEKAPSLPHIDTNFWPLLNSFFSGNNTTKISSDITTLNSLTNDLQANVSVLDRIINPKDTAISNCVKGVDGVTEVGCVTPDNDPNQMLGKEGGYTGCVYFTLSDVDSKSVKGKDAIEKGTDGGGAIEIYATKDDALARCEYLDDFKDTLLYSGSYAAVGTLVIRTSYFLDDEQQYNYTATIVEALIKQ